MKSIQEFELAIRESMLSKALHEERKAKADADYAELQLAAGRESWCKHRENVLS